jgi:hypothetical protein
MATAAIGWPVLQPNVRFPRTGSGRLESVATRILNHRGTSRAVVVANAIALSRYGVGSASYHLLEKHALALKRQFVP